MPGLNLANRTDALIELVAVRWPKWPPHIVAIVAGLP